MVYGQKARIHMSFPYTKKNSDDTPTTSMNGKRWKFKKSRYFANPGKTNSIQGTVSINSRSKKQGGLSGSQIMSRKLLRRSFKHTNQSQSRLTHKLGRQLRFKKESIDNTLEEGEIRSCSDAEETPDNAVTLDENDDDCVYIEPKIEQIVIDDDTPGCSSSHILNSFASCNVSVVEEIVSESENSTAETPKLLTSTPFVKLKDDLPAAAFSSNEPPAFFMDISRTPWFELNKCDADYVKLSSLHGRRVEKRRSARHQIKNSDNSPHDVIVLDDSTICDVTLQTPAKKRKTDSDTLDDSVIFISETNPKVQQFIPLESTDVPNPMKIAPYPLPGKKKFSRNDLFTASEKKEMDAYNINAYNPDANEKPLAKKRMVLIDGSNVAFKHSLDQEFSVKGLKICIEYFDKMGHEVKAVVPQFRLHKSSDPDEMNRLHKAGKIVFTPCKFVNGKSSASYDDRFVLQLACELDAAIVSNDNYRDLVNENSGFKKVIANRVMSFTWCNDIFILAKDPYGKWGPPLHSILNRM